MAKENMDVVIVGGSVCGLMHGVMLTRLGHNVHILEQNTELRTQAAGINAGPDVQKFLQTHDLCKREYGLPSTGARFVSEVNGALKQRYFLKLPSTKNTGWEVLYYRLRANFDGLKTGYCPETLPRADYQGKAVYDMGKRVTDISYSAAEGVVTVDYVDVINGGGGRRHADLVIAADGFSSVVRQLVSPVPIQRPYAGYLAWRGTVLEKEMSEEAINLFRTDTTIWMGSHTHCVVYLVPGESGSLTPGERLVNLVWYCNYPESSPELTDILTDVSGHRHRNAVATGKLRDEVWQKQKQYGLKILPPPFAELMSKITQPLVQTISEARSPRASFFNGKLLLVGDALTLFRPHVALSTNQAAVNCLALERVLKGEIDIVEWEREVLGYGYKTLLTSRTAGLFYQFGPRRWIPSVVQLLLVLVIQRVTKLWHGSKVWALWAQLGIR